MNRYADTNVWNDPRSYLPDLTDNLAQIEHFEKVAIHYRKLARKVVWQRRVKNLCIAIAVLTALYFGAEFLR